MKLTTKYKLTVCLCIFMMAFVLWPIVELLKRLEPFTSPLSMPLPTILLLFLALIEIFLFILMLVTADKLGKLLQKEKSLQTAQEKALSLRGILFFVTCLAAALCLTVGTRLFAAKFSVVASPITTTILCVCIGLPLLLTVCSVLKTLKLLKQNDSMQIEQSNELLRTAREDAIKTAEEKRRLLRKYRHRADALAVLLTVCGFITAICGALVQPIAICFLTAFCSFLFLLAGICRLRLNIPEEYLSGNDNLLSEKNYPVLYAIAAKAERENGVSGKVRIYVQSDADVSIGEYRTGICLNLGVILLHILSEDELYRIMLHEFRHVAASHDTKFRTETRYALWQQTGQPIHCLTMLTQAPFSWYDNLHAYHAFLYQFAFSIQTEFEADRAMCISGDAETAASALLKCTYYNHFLWDTAFSEEVPNLYCSETAPECAVSDTCEQFERILAMHETEWNRLNKVEILSRSASHPTVRMRLEAFGITKMQTVPDSSGEAFRAEREQVLAFADRLVQKSLEKHYKENREQNYLKPCAIVKSWEEIGCKLIPAQYADVVEALGLLCRTNDAEALCDRAIAELSPAAAAFALFRKGSILLHRNDDRGIELIYRAIHENKNYVQKGLELIGTYCCRSGNAEELERYRTVFSGLMQERVDHDKQWLLKKGDCLSAETELPAEERAGLIDYITTRGENCLEKLWLLRKTAEDGYFFTAVVLKLSDNTEKEARNNLFHDVFNYLDTVSDWDYSLYSYDDLHGLRENALADYCVFTKDE